MHDRQVLTFVCTEIIFAVRILRDNDVSAFCLRLFYLSDDIWHDGLCFLSTEGAGDEVVLHIYNDENFMHGIPPYNL